MDFLTSEKSGAGSAVPALKNKKRELFCRLYAGEYWGCPEEALVKAGYKTSVSALASTARSMLEANDVRERVKCLRAIRSENSIADDAWIKESLIKIASNAERDSDRIRAITSLCKVLGLTGGKADVSVSNNISMEQGLLPFDGFDDGSA